ncbi:hypothetical protein [Cytobacillus firmus]|uniref:hypothetical protein n=1 Tax=Cytobacillus firmus TaxID=1399 RepID=UPI0018CFED51|nr:hypothetical protein [Cytobacillus firmus]MBG9585551.1 hypothetical protein [Cytobacillus firmus]
MNKIGFIVRVKAKGKEYFYLRKSIREKNDLIRKEKIYSFGHREKAIRRLQEWQNDIDQMPKELINLGYDLDDVQIWLNEINSK